MFFLIIGHTRLYCILSQYRQLMEFVIAAAAGDERKNVIFVEIIVSLMISPSFHVLLMSNVALLWAFDAFMTTLVDFAMDRGETLRFGIMRYERGTNNSSSESQITSTVYKSLKAASPDFRLHH